MIIIATLFFGLLAVVAFFVLTMFVAPLIGIPLGIRKARKEAKANGMTLMEYRESNKARAAEQAQAVQKTPHQV